jgi:hypothetical protein
MSGRGYHGLAGVSRRVHGHSVAASAAAAAGAGARAAARRGAHSTRSRAVRAVCNRALNLNARAPLAGDHGGDDSDVPEGLGLADAARRAAELPEDVRYYIELCSREAGRAADDGADDNKAYDQAAGERGDLLREAAAHAQYLMRSIRRPGERYIMQAVVSANQRADARRIRLLPRGAGAGVGAGAGAGAEAPADAPRVRLTAGAFQDGACRPRGSRWAAAFSAGAEHGAAGPVTGVKGGPVSNFEKISTNPPLPHTPQKNLAKTARKCERAF